MIQRVAVAAAALVLLGCGARSELGDALGGGGAPPSTTASSSTGGGEPCAWGFGPLVETPSASDYFVDGDHLLYATFHHPDYELGALSFDLTPAGPLHALPLSGHDLGFAPVFAAGYGHGVAMSTYAQGCEAVAFGGDGSPLGALQQVTADAGSVCASATATPAGFFVVSGRPSSSSATVAVPLDATALGANATVSGATPAVVATPAGHQAQLASAVLDDGSTVLISSVDGGVGVFARRFDATAHPLGEVKQLFATTSFHLAAVSLGASVLLAWSDGATFDTNTIRTTVLDADLNVGAVHVVVPAPTHAFVTGLVDGGPGPGRLLVTQTAENDPPIGHWIAGDGVEVGAAFTADMPLGQPPPQLVGTPAGPILFGGIGALRVLCR